MESSFQDEGDRAKQQLLIWKSESMDKAIEIVNSPKLFKSPKRLWMAKSKVSKQVKRVSIAITLP